MGDLFALGFEADKRFGAWTAPQASAKTAS
jgi:hypothetical protein